MWVWSLGWEYSLEEDMTTHSSILAWKIPWIEEPGRLQSTGLQRIGHDWSDLARRSISDLKFKNLSYGLCGRGRGWEDLGEWHWNMYTIMYETSYQSRFDARYWMLGAGALGRPIGMVWGGRREEVSGWGTHVYLWWIHFDIWQN